MKIKVKTFAEESELSDFEILSSKNKSTKIAEDKSSKIQYWFDPKTSTVFGYLEGKTTQPVAEFAIKDEDYMNGVMNLLSSVKTIKMMEIK